MVDFFACFTSGTLGDIECIIGQGFGSIFGGPVIATLIVLFIGGFMCFRMKLAPDLTAVFMLSLTLVMVGVFIPQWIFWMLLIIAAVVVGFGLYKFMNR